MKTLARRSSWVCGCTHGAAAPPVLLWPPIFAHILLILGVSRPWRCQVHFSCGRNLSSYISYSLASLLLIPSFKHSFSPSLATLALKFLVQAMASYALSLYKASSSIYDLDVASLSIDNTPENLYVREEARIIMKTSLTIMLPPSHNMSGGLSTKSMARSNMPQGGAKEKKVPACPTIGAIGLKRKSPDSSGPSKCSDVTLHPFV
jgi:hypothetical protein